METERTTRKIEWMKKELPRFEGGNIPGLPKGNTQEGTKLENILVQ